MGADVTLVEGRYSFTRPFVNKIDVLLPHRYLREFIVRARGAKAFLGSVAEKRFDVLLCVECFPFGKKALTALKNGNPGMTTAIFFWDSFKHLDFSYQIEWFDRRFSFDRDDCDRHASRDLRYMPSFFVRSSVSAPREYDLSFIGTVNESNRERIRIVAALEEYCAKRGLRSFLYLKYFPPAVQVRPFAKFALKYLLFPVWRDFYRLTRKYTGSSFLKSEPLELDEVRRIEAGSFALVDISHGDRHGLSLCCLQALGNGHKLLTTNPRILREPFWREGNVTVFSADSIRIPDGFFDAAFDGSADMGAFEIHEWLDSLCARG
jgi:hypothetical protein